MQRVVPIGTTSYNVTVPLRSSTTGQLVTGKVYGGVTYSYWRDGASAGATATAITASKGTWASAGFVETDYAGLYQFGIPNACLLTGATGCKVKLVVADCIDTVIDIQLVSATRGLSGTALPDADSAVAGGLAVLASVDSILTIPAVVKCVNTTAVAIGTKFDANLVEILGTAVVEAIAGAIAAAFSKYHDVENPVATALSVNQTGDAYAQLGVAGVDLTALPAQTLAANQQVRLQRDARIDLERLIEGCVKRAMQSYFDKGDLALQNAIVHQRSRANPYKRWILSKDGAYRSAECPIGVYSSTWSSGHVYDLTTDKTYGAYQDKHYQTKVYAFNHAKDEVEGPFACCGYQATDDTHGERVICLDGDGYIWAFYGTDSQDLYYKKSLRPYDPASIAEATEYTLTGYYTYANVWYYDGKIYLMCRQGSDAEAVPFTWALKILSSTNPATATWSADHVICDFPLGPYPSQRIDYTNGNVHLYVNNIPNNRQNIWFAKAALADIATNWQTAWKAADGTAITLPITPASTAPILIRDSGGQVNTVGQSTPAWDSTGKPAMTFYENGFIYFMRWTGSAWTTPVSICAAHSQFDPSLLIRVSNTEWDCYVTKDIGETRGGELWRTTSTDSGATWGDITADPSDANLVERIAEGWIGEVCVVENASTDKKVQLVFTSGDGDGQAGIDELNNICIYGESLPVDRRSPQHFTPAEAANLAAWWDASDAISLDLTSAGLVNYWYDRGPFGITLAPGGAPSVVAANQLNGRRTVTFNGSSNYLVALIPDAFKVVIPSQFLQLFVVARARTSTVGTLIDARDPDNLTYGWRAAYGYGVNWKPWFGMGSGSASFTSSGEGTEDTLVTEVAAILDWTVEPTGALYTSRDGFKIGNTAGGVMANPTAQTGGSFYVGRRSLGDTPLTPLYLTGDIAEIIVLAGHGSPQDTIKIQEYLMAKWGIE